MTTLAYGDGIREGFEYLLETHPEVFLIGQGLWSPWYVGNSMTNLEVKFGKERVIDTPVSESAVTGAAVGAAIAGKKPVVIHPRMDFMLYAMDPIVNQAAKWSHMFGGQSSAGVTVRAIVNRQGEQGAQHSQALHAWFGHVPGLRVVMPSSALDARDLLIASVLSPDPVIYIDDRGLYGETCADSDICILDLASEGPEVVRQGQDITLVGMSITTPMCLKAAEALEVAGISCEVVDVRVLNPFDCSAISESVRKTGQLLCVDPGTKAGSFAGEIITKVVESVPLKYFKNSPLRLALPDAPAPTATTLECEYYFTEEQIVANIKKMVESS